MTDPAYRSLVLDVPKDAKPRIQDFNCYLDIANLAHQFCMTSIEAWALDQFKRVMRSAEHLAALYWDGDELLDALRYTKLTSDRELENSLRNVIQRYVLLYLRYKGVRRAGVLVNLYQHSSLKQEDPVLFGYIFCVVLSAGHQSSLWKLSTRDTRSKLLAAHVYLTPLPSTLPTGWIRDTFEISAAVEIQTRPSCFHECSQRFSDALHKTIDSKYCAQLKKDSPLAGVTALCKLAVHRQSLAESFKHAECQCVNKLLSVVDLKMGALFSELAEKYHDRLD
jgi:hypothetical protein